jgi:rubredoxin
MKQSGKTEIEGATTGMEKYRCDICGYVYDPAAGDEAAGVTAGTSFEDLPDDWECPVCGAGKDDFSVVE